MKTTIENNPHAADSEVTGLATPYALGLETNEETAQIINAQGWHVATVAIDPAIETAQFIVRACNSHAQLVEALKHADRTLGVVLSYFHGQAGQGLAKTLTAESVDEIRATLAALEAAQ